MEKMMKQTNMATWAFSLKSKLKLCNLPCSIFALGSLKVSVELVTVHDCLGVELTSLASNPATVIDSRVSLYYLCCSQLNQGRALSLRWTVKQRYGPGTSKEKRNNQLTLAAFRIIDILAPRLSLRTNASPKRREAGRGLGT